MYPDVSLKAARIRRDELRTLLANGIDPGVHRKVMESARTERAANSFEVIAREWFAKHSPNWAPSHSDKIIKRLERDIFPWIGGRPIAEINAQEILVSLRRVEARGALDTAHRAQQNCGQVFRYAVATGRALRDPCGDLRGALPPVKGEHFAAITEPAAVIASKTKSEHLVPLASQAVAILRELHAQTGHGRYVFPGRDPQKSMSEAAVNAALRRMGYDTKTEITGHGFRATARTILHEEIGIAPEIIEHQLAHHVSDALGTTYNRTKFIKERRAMMQQWADYLEALAKGGKFIAFRKPAA